MSIEQFIENEVKSNDVVLFMKGTPQFPMCGFSGQVVQILDYLGVPFKGLNVLESDELRQGIKAFSNWPTIPQLYVKGEFVGGCDIIREMFQANRAAAGVQGKGRADQGRRGRLTTLPGTGWARRGRALQITASARVVFHHQMRLHLDGVGHIAKRRDARELRGHLRMIGVDVVGHVALGEAGCFQHQRELA